jgi:hypothetical protein
MPSVSDCRRETSSPNVADAALDRALSGRTRFSTGTAWRRTRAGTDVRSAVSPGEVIRNLREHEITLTWNPAAAALQARATQTAKTVTVKAS